MKSSILLRLLCIIFFAQLAFSVYGQPKSDLSRLNLTKDQAFNLRNATSEPMNDPFLASKGFKKYSQAELKKYTGADLSNMPLLSIDALKWKLREGSKNPMNFPLIFQQNIGQATRNFDFVVQSPGFTAGINSKGITAIVLKRHIDKKEKGKTLKGNCISLQFKNANSSPVVGKKKSTANVNSYVGNDKSKWNLNIPAFYYVENEQIYPGIKMIAEARMGRLCYSFLLDPQSKLKSLVIVVGGTNGISLNQRGNMVMKTSGGLIVQTRPRFYDISGDSRKELEGSFVLNNAKEYSFEVKKHDPTKQLLIDPEIVFTTYYGGSGIEPYLFSESEDIPPDLELGMDVNIGKNKNIYVTGGTTSLDFPVTTSEVLVGNTNVFVVRIDENFQLVYATIIGSTYFDDGTGIEAMDDGTCFITGTSISASSFPSDFPTSPGVFRPIGEGGFVARLNDNGSFMTGTFITNSNDSRPTSLIFSKRPSEPDGFLFVAGSIYGVLGGGGGTTGSFQTAYAGGANDGFVVKLKPDLTSQVYATLLGGSENDVISEIDVKDGLAFVTGYTSSKNFPRTANSFQGYSDLSNDSCDGINPTNKCLDAFVTSINREGSGLAYSTFFGSPEKADYGFGISVDTDLNAYITGASRSSTNHTTSIFIEKFDPTGQNEIWGRKFLADGFDHGKKIVVDEFNNVHITGTISQTAFETGSNSSPYNGGATDFFYAIMNSTNGNLSFFTYLGGNGADKALAIAAHAIAVDGFCALIAGVTVSDNIETVTPLTNGGNAYHGGSDILLYGLCNASPFIPPPITITKTGPLMATVHGTISYRITVNNGGNMPVPVTVVDHIPDCIHITDFLTPPGGNCSLMGNILTCTFAAQPNNTSIPINGTINDNCSCGGTAAITNTATLQIGTHYFPNDFTTSIRCALPRCGDGVINPQEECDGTPNCRENCTERKCGDGIQDPDEECDVPGDVHCTNCKNVLIEHDPCTESGTPCPPGTHCGRVCYAADCNNPIEIFFNFILNRGCGDGYCDAETTCIKDE